MKRIILSGGGTGGHIYPAVATAQALQKALGDDVELLFVGAEGKMEMNVIPKLGYRIEGVPIAGLQRRMTAGNLTLPIKVSRSIIRARKIIRQFRPDVVAGFGGFASAPIVWSAQTMGIPTVIQEQNSYAGLTNKLIGRRACSVCVAYDGMERFFPSDRIVMTGNPLRNTFHASASLRDEALAYYGFDGSLRTLLVVGGSLGTRTLNEMMKKYILLSGGDSPIQVIWQTGRYYEKEMVDFLNEHPTRHIWQGAFIDRMDYAYAASDLVISRSGACTVSELCLEAKPAIFVPSPNVAEDHQTKNAMALVRKGAARIVPDAEATERCMAEATTLINDSEALQEIARNISSLAIVDSADRVAREIIKYAR